MEAVLASHTTGEDYDVCLVDWKMPDMDGIEVTRRVKEYVGPDATIAAMTADAVHEDVVRAGEAGMNVHLAKPIDPEHLFQKIETSVAGAAPAACAG